MSPRVFSRRTLLTRTAAGAVAAAISAPCVWTRSGEAGVEDSAGRLSAWDGHVHFTGINGTVPERVAKLLKCADRLGIERIVLCMGTRFNYHSPPEDFRRQNDEVLEAIACNPQRVLGFVYVNPQHEQESLAEIDRCVRHGPMVGVKLWVAMVCSRPPLDSIAQRAGELGVPVFQHTYFRTGPNLPDESSPADLATLANRHPKVSFIAGHTGNDWERGIRAIRAAKNVLADISGCDPCAGMVEMAVRELGAERVVFGSDAAGRSFASQLGKVYGASIPVASKRLILRDNLRRLVEGKKDKGNAASGGLSRSPLPHSRQI